MRAADLTETTLERAHSPALFFRHYLAENEKARMVIAHGLGEHSGRYLALADHLAGLGLSLWMLDLRGHGRSGGGRGHVDDFGDYAQDVREVLAAANQDKPPRTPLFLLGHSMGGLVAILAALENQHLLAGLVLSAPFLDVSAPLPAYKDIFLSCLARLLPRLGISNELDPGNISRDPETVRRYIDDPLVHDRVSPRWYVQFKRASEKARRAAPDIKVPILIQAAGKDKLVSTGAVVTFFEGLTTPDRELKVYDDLYHEVYNETEPDRQKVIADLTTWLAGRIA